VSKLRGALYAALSTGADRGQLRGDVDLGASADLLALLAYGVNMPSRAGADARTLKRTVAAAVASISDRVT